MRKNDLRVLVIGCGNAGRRHIANLLALGATVAVFDSNADRMSDMKRTPGVDIVAGVAGRDDWDAWIIATPPDTHYLYASQCPCTMLVEKPLDTAYSEAWLRLPDPDRIAVGYNLRFHPAVRRLRQHVESKGPPLFIRAEFGHDVRKWPPAEYRRHLGVVHDAMTHEIDYVLWLMQGQEVRRVEGVSGRTGLLLPDREIDDVAEAIITFGNGTIASIRSDLVQQVYRRECVLTWPSWSVRWDWRRGITASLRPGWMTFGFTANDMYEDEMRAFLDVVEGKTTLKESGLATVDEALRTVQICQRISS